MFSILIPSYNNLEYLKLCINSILKNSKYNHQIIIHVNEGSDGTLEYVKENKITLIIVEHNIQRALLADRCLKLEKVTDSSSSILVEVDK